MEGWCLYQTCPIGTSKWEEQPVPVGQADWHRLCLSQWDRQAACTKPVPLGLTRKGQKRPPLVPRDKSYTHAGGLSLSRDKLYTHDGDCPSSTCPNLSHKVSLQGCGTFRELQVSFAQKETWSSPEKFQVMKNNSLNNSRIGNKQFESCRSLSHKKRPGFVMSNSKSCTITARIIPQNRV